MKATNMLFGEFFFFLIEFQTCGLPYGHGLLWIENVPHFDVSSNEVIENFINKYLTMDETIF